jgi:hypothetical protein
MSVVQQILARVEKIPLGTPFTPREFISLGNRINVGKILERLTIAGKIKRVRRGIYICPKFSRYVGEVPPSIYEVLQTITAITGETLQVQGAEATRQLGLSTQAPVRESFLTSGRSRKILINNQEVKLRHVSPKKLVLAGTQAGIAITALWYLGKEEVTIRTLEAIENRLEAKEFQALLNHKKLMPAWMATVVSRYEQQMNKQPHE